MTFLNKMTPHTAVCNGMLGKHLSSDFLSSTRVGLRRGLGRLRRTAIDLVYPPRCAKCDAELAELTDDLMLCDECRERLGPKVWPCCEWCGLPSESPGSARCPRCGSVKPRFDTVVPLGAYDDALREVVLQMKRPAGDHLSMAMGALYGRRRGARLAAFRPDMVAPVPMFWRRRMVQGTNSAEILARGIARHLRVPLARAVLVRCRNTLPQADLPPSRRLENVRGAFRLGMGYAIQGARVVLVDDILTTGATCNEAAKVLKQSGAALVVAAVVARADGRKRG